MLKLKENKLATLRRFDDVLNEKYGSEKSVERKEFDAKAKAWYLIESSRFFMRQPHPIRGEVSA